jgi:hypothetical protein
MSILMLAIDLHLGLPSGLFASGFPTNNLHTFIFSHSCHMPNLLRNRLSGNTNITESRARPAHKTDNLTAICEATV